MRLRAKVIIAMQQQLTTARASALTTSIHPDALLLKFTMNENRQVALRGHKGLAGTKLGLDEDFMPTQQACKSNLWSLFKKAKAASKRAFWHATKLFVNDTQICPPSFI